VNGVYFDKKEVIYMKNDRSKIAGSISLIAGLWLALFAVITGMGFASSTFIVGALVTLFALFELFSAESTMWVSWLNGILGVWLLVSPIFMTGLTMGIILNSVILGLIVLGVAIWGGMSSSSTIGMGHPKMG
jgi:hypothetical protein